MSITYEDLRAQGENLISAQNEHLSARIERDEARNKVKEAELSVRYAGTLEGKIDGKNAEAREAQEAILRKEDPDWQAAVDRARRSEEAFLKTQYRLEAESMRLKIMAMGWNAQIADKTGGNGKLLAEVGVASLSS